jgi:hypothetical protein
VLYQRTTNLGIDMTSMSSHAGLSAVLDAKPSLLRTMGGDGRPLLLIVGVILFLSGVFALFLGMTRQFLPHDERFLGMSAGQLCALQGCRIVHFMIHDRVSFGGVLIAIGLLYLWLVSVPLRQGEAWVWWLLLMSGIEGFGSFLAYLGYCYLDTWHGIATLALLPCFILGLVLAYHKLRGTKRISALFQTGMRVPWYSALGLGRACLLATAAGLVVGGFTIMMVGMTCVFVPQDLAYLGLSAPDMHALNPRLVPLIAHDRAGFGGGVCCTGIVMFFCVWCGTPSRGLWQVLCLSGTVGFATAIGVHPAVGYNDVVHLAPAICGALMFVAGLVLTFRPMVFGSYLLSMHVLSGLPEEQQ